MMPRGGLSGGLRGGLGPPASNSGRDLSRKVIRVDQFDYVSDGNSNPYSGSSKAPAGTRLARMTIWGAGGGTTGGSQYANGGLSCGAACAQSVVEAAAGDTASFTLPFQDVYTPSSRAANAITKLNDVLVSAQSATVAPLGGTGLPGLAENSIGQRKASGGVDGGPGEGVTGGRDNSGAGGVGPYFGGSSVNTGANTWAGTTPGGGSKGTGYSGGGLARLVVEWFGDPE